MSSGNGNGAKQPKAPDENERLTRGTLSRDPGAGCSPARAKGAREPDLVRLSDVKPEEVRWLFKPYLAAGKLALLEGDPSAGKTWVALGIAAQVTRGGSFRAIDGQEHPMRMPANVVYMTREDGLADTIAPRLKALGANLERFHALRGWTAEGPNGIASGTVSLQDLDVLRAALVKLKPALVVIDPVQSFLGADVDMHRANEVRPILDGLVRLAEEHGTSMVLIRHLSKAPTGRALHRGLGSIDFTAAVRSVLLAGEEPESKRRGLVHLKSSLAPAGKALSYTLGESGFAWGGVSDLSASDLLAPEPEAQREDRGAKDRAREFLLEVLGEGPRPTREVKALAKERDVAWRTIERVREELGIVTEKSLVGGKVTGWTMRLPGKDGEPEPQAKPEDPTVASRARARVNTHAGGVGGVEPNLFQDSTPPHRQDHTAMAVCEVEPELPMVEWDPRQSEDLRTGEVRQADPMWGPGAPRKFRDIRRAFERGELHSTEGEA